MRYLIFLLELGLIVAYYFYHEGNRTVRKLYRDYPGLELFLDFVLFLVIVDVIRRLVRIWYAPQFWRRKQEKNNFDYGVDNIAKVIIVAGAIVYLFQAFGIDPQTLLTSMSIVAAAIAITFKEYVNDFVVGLYFSFSRNFEINDYVKMGEYKGKITELQLLKIQLLNDNDDSVLIPNGKVYNAEIINYTRRDVRAMSVDFEVDLKQVTTIEQLEQDLVATLHDYEEFIEADSFNLRVVELTKDSLSLKFQYRLRRFDRQLQRDIKRKTVRAVFSHVTKNVTHHPE